MAKCWKHIFFCLALLGVIAAHLRHQARSSEWGCTRKYTPIQPNFDLAPHLHHSHAKRPRTATHY